MLRQAGTFMYEQKHRSAHDEKPSALLAA